MSSVDWLGGYSSEWSVTKVDPNTWADKELLKGVKTITIERSCTDSVPLIETGTITLDSDADFEEAWLRVWLTASQKSKVKIPIATMLFQQSSARYDYGVSDVAANGYSVLRPVQDRKLAYGYYAPQGADGAAFAARLICECSPAPVSVEGSFILTDNVVFDIGASYLEAVWAVLNAGNWCIQIDGGGTINILPKPTTPSLNLDSSHTALLIPGIENDTDLSDIPNRYYAIDANETAIATNENPDLPTSYVNRGRWIDVVDTSPTRINGETLTAYAQRKLKEATTVIKTRTYSREYWDNVYPFSVVRGSLPSIGLDGDLRVLSQSLTCGAGILINETAGQEVNI